jgi:RimJ/RimL family protein N-acetyltransferase
MRAIPTINTAHVTLRALRPQDFDRFAVVFAQSLKGSSPGHQVHALAWSAFLRNAGQWQMSGFGQWAIEAHGLPRLMGIVGFASNTQIALHQIEASCILHPDAPNEGLARDATRAAHDWFDRVITGALRWRIEMPNQTTERLAQENGYSPGAIAGLLERPTPPRYGNLIGT